MKIRVLTPTEVVLEMDAAHVTVDDITGSLGIRPGHLPVVSALDVGILMAREASGREVNVALDGGTLVVEGDTVTAACPRAVRGESLEELEERVIEYFNRQSDEERAANTAFQKLRLAFLKRLFDMETATAPQ